MPLSMVNAGEPFTIKRIGGKEDPILIYLKEQKEDNT